jgi:hypothetical protein
MGHRAPLPRVEQRRRVYNCVPLNARGLAHDRWSDEHEHHEGLKHRLVAANSIYIGRTSA